MALVKKINIQVQNVKPKNPGYAGILFVALDNNPNHNRISKCGIFIIDLQTCVGNDLVGLGNKKSAK